MKDDKPNRFRIVVEEGSPRGDLYELEQTTRYYVVDNRSGEVVMCFRGELEASFGRESGLWENYTYSGVRAVVLTPDGSEVIVSYCDGREEIVPLPQ